MALNDTGKPEITWLPMDSVPVMKLSRVIFPLAWAWRSEDVPSLGLTLVQASPLWVAALWMAIRPVREGLD